MENRKSPLQQFWPEINDTASAKKAAMQGCWSSLIIAVITGAIAIAAHYGYAFILGIDIYALIDAALFLIIAVGIWKMSRVAAIAGLILFIIERGLSIAEGGGTSNVIILIFFLLMFINGIRGTFKYHQLQRKAV
jgi:hypothetical protein